MPRTFTEQHSITIVGEPRNGLHQVCNWNCVRKQVHVLYILTPYKPDPGLCPPYWRTHNALGLTNIRWRIYSLSGLDFPKLTLLKLACLWLKDLYTTLGFPVRLCEYCICLLQCPVCFMLFCTYFQLSGRVSREFSIKFIVVTFSHVSQSWLGTIQCFIQCNEDSSITLNHWPKVYL